VGKILPGVKEILVGVVNFGQVTLPRGSIKVQFLSIAHVYSSDGFNSAEPAPTNLWLCQSLI